MRVRALKAFAGVVNGQTMQVRIGAEFDLPAGVDWLEAGFVVPVAMTASSAPHLHDVQTAVDPAPATAEKRKKGSK